VGAADQRARDSDAQAVLQAELRRAETRLREAKAAYNNGEPERLGNEANYQRYLDRVERLKADVERAQADVDGLRRELARTGGGTTNTSTGSGTASPR
jgi:phage shock protein A